MRASPPIARDLVLVGGGHAHVHVLKSFAMRPVEGVRVTVIARDVETPYSGMLPGHVAGHYSFAACHIDLVRLARWAGARLVEDEAVGIARGPRQVLTRTHPPIRYDVLSLDIGSTPRLDHVPGVAEHTLVVKPIGRFAERWQALVARAERASRLRLAVVGGGAAGVELALAAQHRLKGVVGGDLTVVLVTRGELLPSHNRRARRIVARLLSARGIALMAGCDIVRVEPGRLVPGDGEPIAFDEALWVTEAAAAPWLAETGLSLDGQGFVAIDETLRVTGEHAIFAAGDVATMTAHPREKAGVYAVRQGKPLAANLRRALAGAELRRALPQRRGLALIGTGDCSAVASRGNFAASGPVWWKLKTAIDRRWMRGYTDLPPMEADAESEMRCGGCAAKVPAEVLARVLAGLDPTASGALAIGLPGADDAALVELPGVPPLLQTVDFFRAMVDDPYLFGRIAATHALGDIYAMGGVPATALAIATVPPGAPAIVENDLSHMLKGGLLVLEAAGAALVGGHSAEGAELALGFAVTGRPVPGALLRKGGLNPGDRLILTKPLGTGVILAAAMRALAPARIVAGAVAAMLQPAAAAAQCVVEHGATACTDVTGFGLLGHLLEMLRASGADATLDPAAIPALDGALALIAQGVASSLHEGNFAAASALRGEETVSPLASLLIDPQTAGGLLAGVPADAADACLARLRGLGYRAAIIGIVEPDSGSARAGFPRVTLAAPPRDRRTPIPLAAEAVT
jgi:selenide,water dikinase